MTERQVIKYIEKKEDIASKLIEFVTDSYLSADRRTFDTAWIIFTTCLLVLTLFFLLYKKNQYI